MNKLPLQVKILDARLGTEFEMPQYGTASAAGLDLRACIESIVTLKPGECQLMSTGMAIHIGNPMWVGLIMPRSGLGHKNGIVLGNLTGVIDADYQGPLMVSCWNRSTEPFEIKPGDRIAQFVLVPTMQAELIVVTDFEESARGVGGFGSTGVG